MTDEPRIEQRREEDRMMLSALSWVKRGPRVLVAAFAFMSGVAGAASWFGAQSSSPGKRITNLEGRVDSGFKQYDDRFTILEAERLRDAQARVAFDQKLDLLLRLGCPTITRADLIRECREQGIIR
jgi:hypothetical protein